jgi:hypothetical protein
MVEEKSYKLTLDRPAIYQIIVPGMLKQRWEYWKVEVSVTVGNDEDGLPVTALTVTIDQAGLHGLLRHLYSLGLPLISVICVGVP